MPAPVKAAPAVETKPEPAAKPATAPKAAASPKTKVYPVLAVNGVPIPRESCRVTAGMMRSFLGYEKAEGDSYLGVDRNGEKFTCTNNMTNRPFDEGLARAWMTEILKKHWRLNGETGIVGECGNVIALQHRGVGLIWAVQEWQKSDHWKGVWGDEEPYIETLIVTGVDESDLTVNTVDTGKPRSIADALYRSEILADYKADDRKTVAKIAEFAVRLCWHRTGAKTDAYTPRRTHAETMDFIERHGGAKGRFLKAVKHIWEKTKVSTDNSVDNYVPAGTAAGLLYLMSCSTSDPAKYVVADAPTEAVLKFDKQKLAYEFWNLLGSKTNDLKHVRDALKHEIAPNLETGEKASSAERVGMIVRAWNQFSADGPMTDAKLGYEWKTDSKGFDRLIANGLKYGEDSHGNEVLVEIPTVGGIDLGDPKPEKTEEPEPVQEPTQREKDSELADELSAVMIRLRQEHPNQLLAFPTVDGQSYRFYAGDASKSAQALGLKPFAWKGFNCCQVAASDMPFVADKLRKAKLVFGVVTMDSELNATGVVPYKSGMVAPVPTPAEAEPEGTEDGDPSPEELERRKAAVIADRSKPAPKLKAKAKPGLKGGTGK